MEIKISIVIPTYGRTECLKKLINSILISEINKDDYEIIIVSSDSPNHEKIQWLNNLKDVDLTVQIEDDRKTIRNRSLYYYENVGIKKSKYDWILVCNDDMWFEPDWYFNFKKHIKSDNNVYLISSHIGNISLGLRIPSIGTITKDNLIEPMWLYDMTIIHKTIYEKVNFLDESISWYGKGADLSLSVAFLTNENPVLCHNVKINHDIIGENRINNIGISPNGDDFEYIRKKWNKWIIDNNKNFSYNWI